MDKIQIKMFIRMTSLWLACFFVTGFWIGPAGIGSALRNGTSNRTGGTTNSR